MTKKDAIALIKDAYSRLECLDNITLTPYRQRLYDMAKQSEKAHRRFKPDYIKAGISVDIAAKLFTVKYIADFLVGEGRFTIKDLIHVRAECMYAQSVAANYSKEIRAAWSGINLRCITAIDYPELMR